MRRSKLDKIDKKILKTLQKEGRITNVDLAKNVGISAPPCLRRVRALEEAGYIRSYHAKVDSGALGYSVTIFAMVKLTSQAEADINQFEKRVREWPMVRECHMLTGETDYILKIAAKDWDSYQQFLTQELIGAPNVTSVKSSLAIRAAKEEPGVPIDDAA
jgi:DNA-binding Lrp family transcriptional regulator